MIPDEPTTCNPPVPSPPRCPTCGAPWPPLDLARSGLLDYVVLAKDVLSDLQAALESEALP
jgi:hypothetical protein